MGGRQNTMVNCQAAGCRNRASTDRIRLGHCYGKVSITGNSIVTNGNVTRAAPDAKPRLIETPRSHLYKSLDIKATASGKPSVVNGEVGPGSGRHRIEEVLIDGGRVVNGDIDSIETREAYFTSDQRMTEPREPALGNPDRAEGDDVVEDPAP